MGEFMHLVVVKFKEDVVVRELIKGMEKLVSDTDIVKSFKWGQDIHNHEMLTQGFTHAFLMTFNNQEEYTAFVGHPKHLEFSGTFSTAIEKIVVLDFPAAVVSAPPPPAPVPAPAPAPAPAAI
ncbi:Dabb domain-containing protein [Cephalotus follicularis]|uniref:Dabb domain-containing protein n=1 Tax=Cephalotus follicularis TaxID=3775 RepID=A0A1Q3B483_CEPFO|nr:Dabb domain-containing protein [Cephalotus follicularis]